MEHYETVTINSRPSRSLSAVMLEKEIKISQPKELSRKRDPKKSEGAIIKNEKICDTQKQATLDVVNTFSLSLSQPQTGQPEGTKPRVQKF